MNCLFCKIASGQIPSKKILENDRIFAFHDIQPVAPIHALVIPKVHYTNIAEITDVDLMGAIFSAGREVARELGLEKTGFRLVVNTGDDAGQSVFHLHVHVLGGRKLAWPPG